MIDRQLKLLIRADAWPLLGTGHVMRMMALGQAWSRLHGEVAFVCGDLPAGLVRQIEQSGFQLYQIRNSRGDASDVRDTGEIADVFEPDWIALDGPKFDDSYQRLLSRLPAKILLLDDFRHATHQHADLVLNQNATADISFYGSQVSGPEYLAGADFALIRDEFSLEVEPPKRIFAQARRILVSFSDADPENRTLRTLQLLSDLQHSKLVVDCVTGFDYQHLIKLEEFKRQANMHLRIHRNFDRLSTLMQHVDLAITGGGSTCYELAHCGVPSIEITVDEKQRLGAATLTQSGAMISIDEHPGIKSGSNPSEAMLHRSIRRLMNNRDLRTQMSELGMRLVDGLGAGRVARRMAARCFSFRSVDLKDARLLCEWHNDPEVRSVSFDEQKVTYLRYQSWLRKKMSDENTYLWIAEDSDSQPIGQVQTVVERCGTAFISLTVDQARRGRGLGTVLIEHALETAFKNASVRRVLAQIRPLNVASERAFKNAGFQPTQPTTVAGELANQLVFERSWLRCVQPISPGLKKTA